MTSNSAARMGLRRPPLAFTQEAVSTLSTVLRSDRAVQMSIAIMRTFVRMRELMASHQDIAARVEKLERGHDRTASVIEILAEDIESPQHAVEGMKALPAVKKHRIGFKLNDATVQGASSVICSIDPSAAGSCGSMPRPGSRSRPR